MSVPLCQVAGCKEPAYLYVLRSRRPGPFGGYIKSVTFKAGAVVDVDDPHLLFGERKCIEHGCPKLFWQRQFLNTRDYLQGV